MTGHPHVRHHRYTTQLRWAGNEGMGTTSASAYSRAHVIAAPGKPDILGSSDPAFRGDPTRWNPEELLLAALSACHKLWYLGLCAQAGIVVHSYEDEAEGTMVEEPDGAGQFTAVTLRPRIVIAAAATHERAAALHGDAHAMCFIARSVNFPVAVAPSITVLATGSVEA